ncbi:hypothetical protein MRX96_007882 [Rhipicephalus microplus]
MLTIHEGVVLGRPGPQGSGFGPLVLPPYFGTLKGIPEKPQHNSIEVALRFETHNQSPKDSAIISTSCSMGCCRGGPPKKTLSKGSRRTAPSEGSLLMIASFYRGTPMATGIAVAVVHTTESPPRLPRWFDLSGEEGSVWFAVAQKKKQKNT